MVGGCIWFIHIYTLHNIDDLESKHSVTLAVDGLIVWTVYVKPELGVNV